MNLILHIGMHKTGTSSIQDTLFSVMNGANSPYIHFGKPNSSHAIMKGFSSTFKKHPGVKAQGLSDAEIKKRRDCTRSLVAKTLKSYSGEWGIISAEKLMHLSYEDFSDFLDFVSPYCSSIKAVGYVRSPHSYVQSVFQQRLKKSRQTLSNPKVNVRYRSIFRKFDGALGINNVVIRKFSPESLHNGCVVQDFLSYLGIKISDQDILRTNDSLSAPAVQLLYIYRLFNPIVVEGDMEIVNRLRNLKGLKFELSNSVADSLAEIEPEDVDWMEKRIGVPLGDLPSSENAFATELDFISLSESTLEWLREESSVVARPNQVIDLSLISSMIAGLASGDDSVG